MQLVEAFYFTNHKNQILLFCVLATNWEQATEQINGILLGCKIHIGI